ncbi:hypothetical protein [Pseudomonas japonica]|uniref:Uncharacterized protein n=1 Tax=Pseudomonas japonica TaxID=256466 RepID=A0A239AD35_9PSED|nr:hypothetical protein [Pseudomonas japonica]SNR92813.1 hypothetical protein SAMN05444352_101333 [Pseudomonas japonica]
MSKFLLHLCGTLSLCLLLGLGGLQAHALSGPEVAQRLNQAYVSTPDRCVNNRAAYYCSGVMFKQTLATDPVPFWSHGPDAIGRGAERFDFLRSDITPGPLAQDSGYIFADRFTAIGQDKDYQLQGDDGMNRPPELLVLNWAALPPTLLPVQALYYRSMAGLKLALRNQLDWFEATGDWLPVLRFDAAGSPGQQFGFELRDQLYYGYQVADRINRRFADTASTCPGGRSALYCNGVIIRGTGFGAAFHSWNPSPNSVSRDGVSFTLVRSDVGTTGVVGTEGLIFHELGRPAAHSVRFRCAYPANAGTSTIPNSCRASCKSENITTVAAWRAKYNSGPGGSCTFLDTPAEIQLNTDVRVGQSWANGHNELIIGAWPQDIPSQLPIEAFFWEGGSGLNGARYIQNDFLQETVRFMPIVRVDLSAAGAKFVYVPADQSY